MKWLRVVCYITCVSSQWIIRLPWNSTHYTLINYDKFTLRTWSPHQVPPLFITLFPTSTDISILLHSHSTWTLSFMCTVGYNAQLTLWTKQPKNQKANQHGKKKQKRRYDVTAPPPPPPPPRTVAPTRPTKSWFPTITVVYPSNQHSKQVHRRIINKIQ